MPRNLLPILVIVTLVLVAIGLGFVFLSSAPIPEESAKPSIEFPAENDESNQSSSEADEERPADNIVNDDGESLWVSPTNGTAIPLTHIPSGTQLILHLRPAEILAHPEGEKIVAALGPWGTSAIEKFETDTGIPLKEVESLTIAVHPTITGDLHTTWRLQLVEPLPSDQRVLPESSEWSCFVPVGQNERVLVYCHPDDGAELMEQGDEPALFPRDMQRLLSRTDWMRSATLVLPTKFFKTEGHKLLGGGGQQLREVLDSLAGDTATAIALSIDWQEHFFLELTSNATLNISPQHLAKNTERWIPEATATIESALINSPPHPHSRKVVSRFPEMLRLLSNHTRGSEVDGLSVLRCYLPQVAGHNLLMASELALSLPGKSAPTSPLQIKPKSVQEKLQLVTSLSFPKDTLERALEILAEELEVEIQIAGGDLQLEGITKNQSFAIDLRNQTAEEILQAILGQANPDRTAVSLADRKQKLVYVLRDPESPEGVIVVTTRAAAAKRGETLPTIFVQNAE